MRPIRSGPSRALLVLALILPLAAACRSGAPPVASPTPTVTTPSASPSATVTTPAPTTTTPGPTQTTPSTGWSVVSARVAYEWRWPNAEPSGAAVTHTTTVPPVPQLVTIGVGDHPNDPGDRPYNRMSFSFTTAYPSYRFQFVDKLVGDASGLPIPLAGRGVLRIVFTPAQAHTQDGSASTIASQPPANLGLSRMVAYAQAGDFEAHLTYGIGIAWPIPESNPQISVRVYEVTYVNGQGVYRYVVAFDVDAR